jgi:hypothetical protein
MGTWLLERCWGCLACTGLAEVSYGFFVNQVDNEQIEMSETNVITELSDIKVHKHDNFVVMKGKTQGDLVFSLGVDQIPWLHEALNHLYEIRANQTVN